MLGAWTPSVLVRGVGEIASAVAVMLRRQHWVVALQQEGLPATIRRSMAFSDAVIEGDAEFMGYVARRIANRADLMTCLHDGTIPVFTCDVASVLAACRWFALVDARMNKRSVPEVQIGMAPLVIGVGPENTAGINVDVAVETSWEALGHVVREGSTLPLRGEPRPVQGFARERFRYAPKAGIVRGVLEIGQIVDAGGVIAWVGDVPVQAPFPGVVRGLVHDGVPVATGEKIAEIDPRIGAVSMTGLDERPRRIGEAVSIILDETFPWMGAARQPEGVGQHVVKVGGTL